MAKKYILNKDCIIDTSNFWSYDSLWEIVPILNGQSQEIYKLHEKIKKLEKKFDEIMREKIHAETKLYVANEQLLMQMDYDQLTKENQDMEFEIIELKKEMSGVYNQAIELSKLIDDLGPDEMKKQRRLT